MINISYFLLMCVLLSQVEADNCELTGTESDLSQGVVMEYINMLFHGTQVAFTGCSGAAFVRESDIYFLLYTRNNPIKPLALNASVPLPMYPNKPTIILVPTWLCNLNNGRMPQLKNAYLQRYDCNIIGIDWSAYAKDYYTTTVCNAGHVAVITANFLCNIDSLGYINLAKTHLVGHSVGAQLGGLIGQEVQKECGAKIGRITGLDPAGLIYNYRPVSERLDPSDAIFVDVIHTNIGAFGYAGSCGTIDFYPYCGVHQPGCSKITSLSDIVNFQTQSATCSHFQSVDYMVDSILSKGKFVGTQCTSCPLLCLYNPLFWLHRHVPMGEDCPQNLAYREYYTRRA